MGFIGEESVPVICDEEETDDYNDDCYTDDDYEDDFIIVEQEENYQHFQEQEYKSEICEYYEW